VSLETLEAQNKGKTTKRSPLIQLSHGSLVQVLAPVLQPAEQMKHPYQADPDKDALTRFSHQPVLRC
jgi:hypothetical protein